MQPLKVSLPNPDHTHWSTEQNRFIGHSHPHAGPHRHRIVNGRGVVVNEPGNYSPKPTH